jgi:hypothetical protein
MPQYWGRTYRHLVNASGVQGALVRLQAPGSIQGAGANVDVVTVIATNCALTQLRSDHARLTCRSRNRFKEDQEYFLSERLEGQEPSPEDEYRKADCMGISGTS